LKQNIANSCA